MIKLAFFDFSKTVAKDSGLNFGAAFMKRGEEYDKFFEDFVSHNINEEEFIKSTIKLWEGFKVKDLPMIYTKIRLSPNVSDVLKQLKGLQIKLALVSHIPLNLAELYRNLSFDYLLSTECEWVDVVQL